MPGNFSYLIGGRLAGMERPGTHADLQADLQFLDKEGFSAIVSLTETPLPQESLAKFGFEYLHLPVPDFAPPSLAQARQFMELLDKIWSVGGSVLVHCGAGIGRTGTILACALVTGGMTAEEAVRQVRQKRPHSVETTAQEQFVYTYERALASRRAGGEKAAGG